MTNVRYGCKYADFHKKVSETNLIHLKSFHNQFESFSRCSTIIFVFKLHKHLYHGQCVSATHSLTHSCLINLIDVTLACEDAYSKLVEAVTVADVSDEDCVGISLFQIGKLRFGHKA